MQSDYYKGQPYDEPLVLDEHLTLISCYGADKVLTSYYSSDESASDFATSR